MSLDQAQRAATQAELRKNLALSGLTASDVADDLGLQSSRARAALEVAGARPEDVWLVRDYLDRVIRSAGTTPQPYSSLTEDERVSAHAWFSLFDLDEVLAEASR